MPENTSFILVIRISQALWWMTFLMGGQWVYSCHHDQHRIAIPERTRTYETGGSFEGDFDPLHMERRRAKADSKDNFEMKWSHENVENSMEEEAVDGISMTAEAIPNNNVLFCRVRIVIHNKQLNWNRYYPLAGQASRARGVHNSPAYVDYA